MATTDAVGVRLDREKLNNLLDLIEKATGYRPSIREALDKAMQRDIERLEADAESRPKRAKTG